jgi:SagB-type dehydrogenase family enzyme
VILKRGSTRRFDRGSGLSFNQFSTLLYRSTRGIPADFLSVVDGAAPVAATPGSAPAGAPHLNQIYMIVHAVDGLEPGAYALDRDGRALEMIKAGEFRREAGYLGLEQTLPAEAAATIFFIADLNAVFERFGNRGYRAAQLESGIIGGKIYLAAYAQGFGASGLTFYDDDVVEFFSPRAQGDSAIFQVAIGRSARRRMEVVQEVT